MGGDALAARARSGSASIRRRPRPTAASRWSRSIASAFAPVAPAAMLDGTRRRPARRQAARRAARGGAAMSAARIYVPARCRGASRSAPTRSRATIRGRAAQAQCRRRDRPHRLARPATGWSRWSKSRRRQGRVAYGPVAAGDVEALFEADACQGGAASAAPRRAGGHSLPEAPDAADLRPLRHRRSALARRLPRPWRLARPRRARSRSARRRSSRRSRNRACAAAAAPAFRPASNGRPSPTPRPRRNTSSATPTRATAAPSPTA